MKNKHTLFITIICTLFLSITSEATILAKCPTDIPYAIQSTASGQNPSEILPASSEIVWKYKFINGVLYKRKYNATKKEWIGDWIKVV